MPGRFLFDTNIVIDLLVNKPAVVRLVDENDDIYISVATVGELYYGAYKSKNRDANIRRIEDLYKTIMVLPHDKTTADNYDQIKAVLKAKGKPIPDNDIWIAATAKQYGLVLATRDKHFSEVAGIQIVTP